MDKQRWIQLSSHVDELSDLNPTVRRERIADIGSGDPESASALESLIADLTALDEGGFVQVPAVLPAAELTGQVVGAYTLERELGRGGMGTVWLARRTDGRYEGRVAIKFLSLALLPRGGAQRFALEGSILARLSHPNIARLLDAGIGPREQPYLVLEYIDGEPIDRYCEHRALTVRARLQLFLDVLAAVAHAHNRLILHRDLKPGNILVTTAGEVKLLDFGIAKLMDAAHVAVQVSELTQLAGRALTPAYAAPEQAQDGDITTATDVYALGVLLYVLLCGVHPTNPDAAALTPLEELRTLVEIQPRRLSDAAQRRGNRKLAHELRGDLDSILAKALEKSAARRYANAAAFADDVRRHLNLEPISARPDSMSYRTLKLMRRHRLAVGAVAAIVLTLAGGVGAALMQAREVQVQQNKAEGLIDFMLGDLRTKLEPAGRLDVLGGVGERVLAYYDGQTKRLLDDSALGRRSRALHLIGEIAELRGDLELASRMAQSAAASTASLRERQPADAQRIFNHSQSVYWVGLIAWRRGQLPRAAAAFDEYLALARQLVARDASNPDWVAEEGHAHQNLGVLLLDQGKPAQALAQFEAARARFESVIGQRAVLLSTLISNRGWIGQAKEATGDISGAIEAVKAQALIQQQRTATADDRQLQQAQAIAESELGRLELFRGAAAAALPHVRTAVELLSTLRAVDPQNVLTLQELAWAHVKAIDVNIALGEQEGARTELREAQRLTQALLAKSAEVSKRQVNLSGSILLSEVELALRAHAKPSVAALQSWLSDVIQRPLESGQEQLAARACLVLGDVSFNAGDLAASEQQWRAGVRLLAAQAQAGTNPMQLTVLAQLQLRLGDEVSARALARRIAASDFRHPAYADLNRRLETAPPRK